MRKLTLKHLSLFASIMVAQPTFAHEADEIVILGTSVPGLFDVDLPGPYNHIFEYIISKSKQETVLTMTEMARAGRVFGTRDIDCMFLGAPNTAYYEDNRLRQDDLLFSDPVNRVALKAYGPIGATPIESMDELQELYLAIDVGIGEASQRAGLSTIQKDRMLIVPSLEDGFNLLDQGRVSALIAMDFDVHLLSSKKPNYRQYSVSETFALHRTFDLMVCKKSMKTLSFLTGVNKTLGEMRQSGLMDKILVK